MVSLRTAFPARHINKGYNYNISRQHGGRGGWALVVGPGVWPIVVGSRWRLAAAEVAVVVIIVVVVAGVVVVAVR